MILNLQNIYYFLNNLCNLVSLEFLNNSRIYHNNENKILYQLENNRILAQTKQQKNNYLFKLFNFLDIVIFLAKINNKAHKQPFHAFFNFSSFQTFLLLTTWYKPLRHINFSSLKIYLKKQAINYINDLKDYICNNY